MELLNQLSGPDAEESYLQGYRHALQEVARRLDNLLTGATDLSWELQDLSWQLGVEAAQAEVQELKKGYVSDR